MTENISIRSAPRRFSIRLPRAVWLVLLMIVAVPAVMGVRSVVQINRRRAVSREIEGTIRSLVSRRPSGVTRGKWGSAVAWTLNLHGNSLIWVETEEATLRRFQGSLHNKIAGIVDMATINWIWDEYTKLTPHGRSYQRFKELMDEELAAVAPDEDIWGMRVP